MSLPNPNMDFVPLDVLTAEEMDKIVANIESLSAGAGLTDDSITTEKLTENSVTIEKIADDTITNIKIKGSVDGGEWKTPALQNGWSDYGGGFSTAGYRRIGNQVFLKGLVKGGQIRSFIFKLPNKFRPHKEHIIVTVSDIGFAEARIHPDGNVNTIKGTNGWFSLDNISFFTD